MQIVDKELRGLFDKVVSLEQKRTEVLNSLDPDRKAQRIRFDTEIEQIWVQIRRRKIVLEAVGKIDAGGPAWEGQERQKGDRGTLMVFYDD